MLACRVFLSDKLLYFNDAEIMKYVELQVIRALIAAGANPYRVLWMQEETSHFLEGYEEVSDVGRFRIYFEVPLQ